MRKIDLAQASVEAYEGGAITVELHECRANSAVTSTTIAKFALLAGKIGRSLEVVRPIPARKPPVYAKSGHAKVPLACLTMCRRVVATFEWVNQSAWGPLKVPVGRVRRMAAVASAGLSG